MRNQKSTDVLSVLLFFFTFNIRECKIKRVICYFLLTFYGGVIWLESEQSQKENLEGLHLLKSERKLSCRTILLIAA